MATKTSFKGVISSAVGAQFPPQKGRYHLYISYACPWASRCLLFRNLRGLHNVIGLSVVAPRWDWIDTKPVRKGWVFKSENEVSGCIPDTLNNFTTIKQLYDAADPNYSGRYSVPVLWDSVGKTIVSNESSDIMRMFNSAFNAFSDPSAQYIDLCPDSITELGEMNDYLNNAINTGVYKCGFAKKQEEYEIAFAELFRGLDILESRLSTSRYLFGSAITEADIRLFVTLVRFDAVYYSHFKANKQRLVDYPNLWGFTRDIYQLPGVADTVNITHIKQHYYGSHDHINPSLIVPLGPYTNFQAPHDRWKLA